MRIAYVTETFPPEINGVSLTAERALRHLRAAGHQVLLVRPRQRGERPSISDDEWRTGGGPIPMYPELRYGFAAVAQLRRRWRGEHGGDPMDLVHIVTPGPLAWAALRAARAESIPTSADFRTNFHAYSRHYRLGWLEPLLLGYLRRLHAQADITFVPTRELAAQLARQGFGRVQVVGRGVDAKQFSPQWRDNFLRLGWHAGEHDPVLLHVGRLAAEKNVRLALETFELLRGSHAGLRMVVIGDGPQRGALQAKHPQVLFVGVKRGAELARYFASADVFLFPSLTDTFGNVTLEAMASGLAVVAFNTAAAAQHVRDGVSGWLVSPLHAPECAAAAFCSATAHALADWQPDGALRQEAIRAARQADWDSVLHDFEQLLRATASARRQPIPNAALA